jgi:hypothetical protein
MLEIENKTNLHYDNSTDLSELKKMLVAQVIEGKQLNLILKER